MYFDLAALPLAFALKGGPRLLMVAAWLLIQLYRGSFFIAGTQHRVSPFINALIVGVESARNHMIA
jgi:hypothetical protein